ncbi:J domain-containing protein [Candidatus Woesearchaeota archaeon]|jgi:hypothetical protein|nr:J domain-containing protein [Candidatus Woesearchaeota archaeon]
MAQVRIKGHEFNVNPVKDSFNRRAQQFYNNIMRKLKSIGIPEEDIEIEFEPMALKSAPASVTWYVQDCRLHYSYTTCKRFVDNLFIVSKIIDFEVNEIINDKKTVEQFIFDFSESSDVEEERKSARKILGVEEDSLDFDLMSKNYKQLAKEAHPDMPTGDTERFKSLNRAHKILKRELA